MLKLVGSVLILGCGAAVQLGRMQENRQELETLSGLCAALRQMGDDIRLELTPMPELIRRLTRRGTPSLRQFFRRLSGALEEGAALPEAFREELPALRLGREETAILADLRLSGDEDTLCAALTLAERQLTTLLEEKRRKRAAGEKLSASLCFSAAAFLILLLI